MYLQGLGQVLPDAWVKGVLHSAGDQPYLAIPSEQYLGESKGMAWYFYGDRVEEKLHEPTGTLRLKHHLFEAGDSLRFNYNPQQRTLTTRSDEGFVCNAGTIDEYMTSELREVSITLTDETVFTAPLLMGDVEIPAIFQVTDAEKKLCQVGSGIIKESGEDIFYGTAVMSIVFGKLEIPAEVNGYQVEAVGPGAFGDCKHLTEVVLPASVTRIGDWAFMNTGLTTMRLPQLTHLGEGALSGCDQLTEIEIPGSLKKVDQFAFSESEYLEKVVIQSGVTEISRCAFAFCYRLQTLEWQSPATVKKIGSLAFKCTDFTSVTLPASLTMIGEGAFSVCNSLQKVVCEAEVPPTIVEVRDAEYIFDGLPDDALLRAMETAGKLVDNDELRDALKENGIGRPSTRAAIIETLFKRNYIRKEKKNLIATPTGVELIQIIHEELLKSAELTGIWEKKLREIEKRTYNAGQFLEELKQMVSEIVMSVLSDNSNRHITIQAPVPEKGKGEKAVAASDKPKKEPKKRAPRKSATKKTEQAAAEKQPADALVGQPCPLCGKGTVIKGKTAYGCSEWKSGCTFRKPFE